MSQYSGPQVYHVYILKKTKTKNNNKTKQKKKQKQNLEDDWFNSSVSYLAFSSNDRVSIVRVKSQIACG